MRVFLSQITGESELLVGTDHQQIGVYAVKDRPSGLAFTVGGKVVDIPHTDIKLRDIALIERGDHHCGHCDLHFDHALQPVFGRHLSVKDGSIRPSQRLLHKPPNRFRPRRFVVLALAPCIHLRQLVRLQSDAHEGSRLVGPLPFRVITSC